LTNNFILPNSNIINENNFHSANISNYIKSKNSKNNLDSPFKTAHFESPISFFQKAKVTRFSPSGNNINSNSNNNNDDLNINNNNHDNLHSNNDNDYNNNFNTNNFIKQNFVEEEKSPNNPLEEIKSTVENYLKIRKSETKLLFGFRDIMNIVCNSYCKRKIPTEFLEKFHFYEKARDSVSHYFDFIFMIKKFEEINILKNCLLSEEQEKMVEIMCKPILSSKEFLIRKNTIRNIQYSVDFNQDINQFLKKVEKKEDRVDRRILRIMQENVKKSYV